MSQINWMENEATQDLRDFIRRLIDSITQPFIHKVLEIQEKYLKETKEIKELIQNIKAVELWKEHELKALSDRLFLLENKCNLEILEPNQDVIR